MSIKGKLKSRICVSRVWLFTGLVLSFWIGVAFSYSTIWCMYDDNNLDELFNNMSNAKAAFWFAMVFFFWGFNIGYIVFGGRKNKNIDKEEQSDEKE